MIQRSQSIHLRQPYFESDQNTDGQFLFDNDTHRGNDTVAIYHMENNTT